LEKRRSNKAAMALLKAAVTLAALAYVFTQLDFNKVKEILRHADLFWLFAALLAFNASKIVSSVRLNRYFGAIGLKLGEGYNLMLYYIGMFYNLFLPGGIGGDGYKVYLLHKHHRSGVKALLQAVVLDRISGLAALLFLAGLLFMFSGFMAMMAYLLPLAIAGMIAVFPATYLVTRYMFHRFLDVFAVTTLLGIAVQLLQLLCALFIVYAINAQAMSVDYLTLFLVSSVVAVLPISIGGVGVRELTFLYGFGLLGSDANSGVLFSFLFFLITALSSLAGTLFLHKTEVKRADH